MISVFLVVNINHLKQFLPPSAPKRFALHREEIATSNKLRDAGYNEHTFN